MINIRYTVPVIIYGTMKDQQIHKLPFEHYKMYYLLKLQAN